MRGNKDTSDKLQDDTGLNTTIRRWQSASNAPFVMNTRPIQVIDESNTFRTLLWNQRYRITLYLLIGNFDFDRLLRRGARLRQQEGMTSISSKDSGRSASYDADLDDGSESSVLVVEYEGEDTDPDDGSERKHIQKRKSEHKWKSERKIRDGAVSSK
jgi:hypothetical protein